MWISPILLPPGGKEGWRGGLMYELLYYLIGFYFLFPHLVNHKDGVFGSKRHYELAKTRLEKTKRCLPMLRAWGWVWRNLRLRDYDLCLRCYIFRSLQCHPLNTLTNVRKLGLEPVIGSSIIGAALND